MHVAYTRFATSVALDVQAAFTWCLAMQEVLQFVEWPDALLRYEQCREEIDADGAPLFRGPR